MYLQTIPSNACQVIGYVINRIDSSDICNCIIKLKLLRA